MNLFQLGNFTLHSGAKAAWKIDCDALTESDWAAIAVMLKERLPPFGAVVGVPRGGLKLAAALATHVRKDGDPLLIVDDVLTTGTSMEGLRRATYGPTLGAVVFARGPCPGWVYPLFQMLPPAPWYRQAWEAIRDWFAGEKDA